MLSASCMVVERHVRRPLALVHSRATKRGQTSTPASCQRRAQWQSRARTSSCTTARACTECACMVQSGRRTRTRRWSRYLRLRKYWWTRPSASRSSLAASRPRTDSGALDNFSRINEALEQGEEGMRRVRRRGRRQRRSGAVAQSDFAVFHPPLPPPTCICGLRSSNRPVPASRPRPASKA
jgi:hypothetical protein